MQNRLVGISDQPADLVARIVSGARKLTVGGDGDIDGPTFCSVVHDVGATPPHYTFARAEGHYVGIYASRFL